jgi:GTP cyclohydrolase I
LQEPVAVVVLDKVLLGLPQLAVVLEQLAELLQETQERLTQAVAQAVGHHQTRLQLQAVMVVLV